MALTLFQEATAKFLNCWLYKFERNPNGYDFSSDEIENPNGFKRKNDHEDEKVQIWAENVALLQKIKNILTDRTIDPTTAAKIHGLSNRQLTYYENNDLMPFKREKGKRRKFSVVDIAWLLILKQFQERANSQVQAIAEQIRYLIDDDVLALCLIREVDEDSRIVALFPEEKEKAIINQPVAKQLAFSAKLAVVIPIANIVEYVLSLAGNTGLITYRPDNVRYFQFSGNLKSVVIKDMFKSGRYGICPQYGVYELLRAVDDNYINHYDKSIELLKEKVIENDKTEHGIFR